jgi:hypothetical protein
MENKYGSWDKKGEIPVIEKGEAMRMIEKILNELLDLANLGELARETMNERIKKFMKLKVKRRDS